MGGGWSLVMLYDHYHGKDFAQPNPTRPLVMSVIDEKNVEAYLWRFGDKNWSKIDFTGFSKVLNPETIEYNFGISGLMKHTEKNMRGQ